MLYGLQLYWLPTVFIPPLEDIYSSVRECGERERGRERRREGGGEGVYCRNNGRALGLVVMTVGRAREC